MIEAQNFKTWSQHCHYSLECIWFPVCIWSKMCIYLVLFLRCSKFSFKSHKFFLFYLYLVWEFFKISGSQKIRVHRYATCGWFIEFGSQRLDYNRCEIPTSEYTQTSDRTKLLIRSATNLRNLNLILLKYDIGIKHEDSNSSFPPPVVYRWMLCNCCCCYCSSYFQLSSTGLYFWS